MGFIIAGHETSSTTLSWAVKYLADHNTVQVKLRRQLHQAMKAAFDECRSPNVHEIINSSMPYLDACIEEILRLACTVPFVVRQATCDTEILGHSIPKGTSVYMVTEGPSILSPAFNIPDSKRTSSALNSMQPVRAWSREGMSDFVPERWLNTRNTNSDDFDRMFFDASSGPTLPFGLGVRGCFGRRLAYLELRLILVLMIWNFELERCPASLSSYDANEGFTRKPVHCYARLNKI